MSYPKEKCDVQDCKYCQYDENYKDTVCEFLGDIDDAMDDPDIPDYCPWIVKATGKDIDG